MAGGVGTCVDFAGVSGCGTVFKFNPSTGQFRILYQFTGGTDGAAPQSPVLIAPDDTLYGSTTSGGVDSCAGWGGLPGCGVVFHLQPRSSPPRNVLENYWIETPLHTFQGPDGNGPIGNFAMDQSGDLYGSTGGGGSENEGVVFEVTPSNGSWSESVLHNFPEGMNDGHGPYGGVTLDAAGNVCGTTYWGGANNNGVVYQLLAGSGWSENLLYTLTGGSDGGGSNSGLSFDSAGNLYGSTSSGGSGGGGTAFKLSSRSWAFELLASFTGGAGPALGSLIIDQAGNVYGTTANDGAYDGGNVFKLTPSGNGYTYTSLHDFCAGGAPCSDGYSPQGTLLMDSRGNLYGTAQLGGSNSGACAGGFCGVIFKISP